MRDFLLSLVANLIFGYKILVLALTALLLHIFLELTIAVFLTLLGIWFLLALLITLGLKILTKDTPAPPKQENINPYSKSSKDFLPWTDEKDQMS